MNQCADATVNAADRNLNIRNRQGMDRAPDDIARAKLLAAQRASIPYLYAVCRVAEDPARGGSMAPLLALACLEHMTSMRALELPWPGAGRSRPLGRRRARAIAGERPGGSMARRLLASGTNRLN